MDDYMLLGFDREEPQWSKYPAVRNYGLGAKSKSYVDIINHYGKRLNERSLLTDAHETTHMINNDIRNASKPGSCGLYVCEDRSIVFPQPKFRKSAIAEHIPQELRGFRFKTYISGQTEWDDSPLYVYDEWVAYCNGGQVGVELVKAGAYNEGACDGVSGCLEFSIYAVATVLAVKKNDPGYLASCPQFMAFTAWNIERSAAIFKEGLAMPDFQVGEQSKILQALKSGNSPIKSTLGQAFGGAFL